MNARLESKRKRTVNGVEIITVELTTNDSSSASADIESVLTELAAIRAEMVAASTSWEKHLNEVHSNYRESAWNLLHYLAVRRRDLRSLQIRLATLGLSSLGRAESHVLATVDAVLKVLHCLVGRPWQPPTQAAAVVDFAKGESLLVEHTEGLLGASSRGRGVRGAHYGHHAERSRG